MSNGAHEVAARDYRRRVSQEAAWWRRKLGARWSKAAASSVPPWPSASGARAGRWSWSSSSGPRSCGASSASPRQPTSASSGAVRCASSAPPTRRPLERLLRPAAGRSSAGGPRAEPCFPCSSGRWRSPGRCSDPAVVDRRAHAARGAAGASARPGAARRSGSGRGCAPARTWTWSSRRVPGRRWARRCGAALALPHRRLPRAGDRDAAEQYAYAPAAGRWRTARAIGEAVAAGALLGTVDGVAVRAPCAGRVRGLVHDGVAVPAGLKLAAVHPGDWRHKEAGIEHRTAAIAADGRSGLAEQHAAPSGRRGKLRRPRHASGNALTPAEHAMLGLVALRPRHGYELAAVLWAGWRPGHGLPVADEPALRAAQAAGDAWPARRHHRDRSQPAATANLPPDAAKANAS